VICSNCGTENRADAKFCSECGTPLAVVCPNGHQVRQGARFCDECGAPVAAAAGATAAPKAAAAKPVSTTDLHSVPVAERRIVSVMFADLVGFTSLSEGRDPEDVRELLGRYFDTARRLVSLYGGTIEKFIGDAVMAVWGTPVVQEDDAERAVRAALDLTAAVAELGAESGAPDLRARAGVLTGDAAVTIGAEGQGMVAGDLVNTASRIQSAATPGAVLVGDATRRATEASVEYEDAGSHEMKGKAEPVPLWRAVRVVAGRAGAMKATSLEAPFVGRDREVRLVKELAHASAEEGRANLLTVIGVAGIGKSRLSWEFEKYVDGLMQNFWWHRGRCLAYGEGVTYWALAEMVRSRAQIVEGESQSSALAKLRAAIEKFVADPDERDWVEPRLAHLLGLEERTARDPEDLFSAWRLFIERMAEANPTVLIFEDMQWADPSLVAFVDYLMNWSKNHPIFILVLARPDFVDKHPGWGTGRRGFTALYLDPLPEEAMDHLLSGLVPGLPAALRETILDRAQGVPLYAVETVRMLLDRELLVRDGSAYRPTGPVEDLEIPASLQALIAARLDGLEPLERRLLQNAAVLGKTFTESSLIALTALSGSEVELALASLLRKEFVTIQADPRSPERGQYGFLQDLVRRVAYDTLARKDRKALHLAAAAYLSSHWGPEEEEIVEVLAAHYVEAYEAAPDAGDAAEIKAQAREALVHAGNRAESLAAAEEARRYYERAIELADDDLESADLRERAGIMARAGGDVEAAVTHLETAIALFESAGRTHPAARVSATYAETIRDQGRLAEARERMEAAYAVLSREEPDADLALFEHEFGRTLFFSGRLDEAATVIESALATAEAQALPLVLAQALNTKSLILSARGRTEESLVLLQHALKVALDNDLRDAAVRAYNNVGAMMNERDRHEDERIAGVQQLELARRVGNLPWVMRAMSGQTGPLWFLGRWDEAVLLLEEIEAIDAETEMRSVMVELAYIPILRVQRGELDAAKNFLAKISVLEAADSAQDRSAYGAANGWVLIGEGRYAEAQTSGQKAFEEGRKFGIRNPPTKEGLLVWVEASLRLGDLDTVERIVAMIDDLRPGEVTPLIAAMRQRWRGRMAASRRDVAEADTLFRSAEESLGELKMPFWRAVTLLEHAECLKAEGLDDDAKVELDEAREIFATLKARPWLERLAVAAGEVSETAKSG